MIDRKFKFVAVNPCNQKVYTEENAIVFCAKDRALPAALNAYLTECRRLRCGESHIESVNLLLQRVHDYQRTGNGECKVPDTETDCEIDRCIGGKV